MLIRTCTHTQIQRLW